MPAAAHTNDQETESATVNILVRIALAVAFGAGVPLAHADDYPSKPVRFIIAFPPGGNADLMGRLAAQKLTEGLAELEKLDSFSISL